MTVKGIVFDLDGTLLDTLNDLADAVNAALRDFSFPERRLEEVRRFVGNGVGNLIRQAVPDHTDAETIAQVHERFMKHYMNGLMNKTKPYPGIVDLLETLKLSGYRLGVLSNKPHKATQDLIQHYFPDVFDLVLGHRAEAPRKPDPTVLLQMPAAFNLSAEEVCYIGDSEVDVATTLAADLRGIFCLWGFRSENELRAAGGGCFIHEPGELLQHLFV